MGTNLAIDQLRKKNHQTTLLEEDKVFKSDFDTPETIVIQRETKNTQAQLLKQLPIHYRLALYLQTCEHMKYKEIAIILDTSSSSVRNMLYQARQKLRSLYKGEKVNETVS